jgi:hypothetical protein
LLKFLLDERLEFERRRLQQGQRLLELRRQHQRLRQALLRVVSFAPLQFNFNAVCIKAQAKIGTTLAAPVKPKEKLDFSGV